MSKAIVVENKHDKQLVALGRSEARKSYKAEKEEEKVDRLKKDRNALRRDVEELEIAVDAGKTSHKVVYAVTSGIGLSAGIAGQVYGLGKVENMYIKVGTLPVLGSAIGIAGFFVDGLLGAGMVGLGFSTASGSAAVSTIRKVLGIP